MRSQTQLIIPRHLLDEIISHCREEYPREACGILAGRERTVQKVFTMTNVEHSHVSYLMDSREQFNVMKEMRDQGLEMVAIYHSHPYADVYPSPKDISLAVYQDALYVIVSLIHDEPLIKAYEIRDGEVTEVEVYV